MTDRNELLQRISAQLDKYGNWDEGCFYYNGTSCAELGALDNEIKEAIAAPTEGGQGEATFAEWLATEMPAGTVIGDPKWWADRIARQYRVRSGVAPAASVDLEQFRDATEMWMNLEDREEGSRLLALIDSAGGAKGDDESTDYECPDCGKLNYKPLGCQNCGYEPQPAEGDGAVSCGKCGVRQPLRHSPDCGRPAATAQVPVTTDDPYRKAIMDAQNALQETANKHKSYYAKRALTDLLYRLMALYSNAAPAAPKGGVVAEIIERLATGNISVEVYGPDNHGANKPWLVSLRNADTDNADEYEGDTLAAALIAALATGEQS